MRTHHKGVLAGLALLLAASLSMAATGTTPVQAAGGGATADEYAKKSDLGFQWTGDVRQRLQYDNTSLTFDRWQLQTRLRLGANGQLAGGKAWWGFRLATRNPMAPAVSNDLTLAGGDANGVAVNIGLDRMFIGYQPHRKVALTLGKQANPFIASEGLFDEDLSPSGLNVAWDIFRGDKDLIHNVGLNAGVFLIREAAAVTADPLMAGAQLNAALGPVDTNLGLYYLTGLNSGAGAAAMPQAVNQLRGAAFVRDQMAILHGRAAYDFSIRDFPIAVSGQIWANLSETNNTHWGGAEARVDLPKLWKGAGRAIYRHVDLDANFSPWADSDLGRGTGLTAGIELGYGLPLTKGVNLDLTYLRWDIEQPFSTGLSGSVNTFQVDVSAGF